MQTPPKKTQEILIVEDHGSLRESLVNWLTDLFPEATVRQASTGEESVVLAGSIQPDIILMDIGLPGINGIEATREILQQGIPSKIVVLTNLDGEIYKKSAMEAGAVEFIRKREMNLKLPSVLGQLMNTQSLKS